MVKNASRNRILIAIVSFVLVVALFTLFLPRLYAKQSSIVSVVRLTESVKAGTQLTKKNLHTVSVGAYGLDKSVATDMNQLVGKVAVRDLSSKDNLYLSDVATKSQFKKTGNAASRLKDGKVLISVSMKSAAAAVAGLIAPGDTVDVYYAHTATTTDINGNTGAAATTVTDSDVLHDMTVYAVSNSDLNNVGNTKDKNASDSKVPAVVTLIATAEQARALTRLEYSPTDTIHLVFNNNYDLETVSNATQNDKTANAQKPASTTDTAVKK